MDRILLMRTFVAAVEAGSFTAAAERLGADPKLVSKHVGALEAQLRTRLFHRTTRSASLTEAGRRYYEGTMEVLTRMEDLEASLTTDQTAVTGLLRVAAPVTFGEVRLPSLIRRFTAANPDIRFNIYLSDRFVDLAEGGFDLALRVGGDPTSSLIARRLGRSELWLVADARYLDRKGRPGSLDDLLAHDLIGDSNLRGGRSWALSGPEGEVRLPLSPRLTVNSARATAELAASGEGIALCPDYVAAPEIAAGRLERVLPRVLGPTLEIRAVFLEPRNLPTRVRRFVDFLSEAFDGEKSA